MFTRHDLVWLSDAGWHRVLAQSMGSETAACMEHWARQRLPLVVGRQGIDDPELALGIAAPVDWDRRKIALRVPRACIVGRGLFPAARDVTHLLLVQARGGWASVCDALEESGVDARVHGSYGWQRLTGMRHLTPSSDLDMLLAVRDAAMADAASTLLESSGWEGPRIDGELLFPDGRAVAWREWLQWRRGAVDRVLVKRLYGVTLEAGTDWLADRATTVTAG